MPWRSCLFFLFLRNGLVEVRSLSVITSLSRFFGGSGKASLNTESGEMAEGCTGLPWANFTGLHVRVSQATGFRNQRCFYRCPWPDCRA